MTTCSVPASAWKYSVWPENGRARESSALFCTGAVTSAEKAPVAQASAARVSICRMLCAFDASGCPGVTGTLTG